MKETGAQMIIEKLKKNNKKTVVNKSNELLLWFLSESAFHLN